MSHHYKKTLQQCVKSVASLFTKSNQTAARLYPFVGMDKIGYVSIATVVKDTADPRHTVAGSVTGYEVSDVTTTVRGIYHVYDFVLYDKSVDIAPIHRATGSGKSINVTFLSIDESRKHGRGEHNAKRRRGIVQRSGR